MIKTASIQADYDSSSPLKYRAVAMVTNEERTVAADIPIDVHGMAWQVVSEDHIDDQIHPSIIDPERTELRTMLVHLLSGWPKVKELREKTTDE